MALRHHHLAQVAGGMGLAESDISSILILGVGCAAHLRLTNCLSQCFCCNLTCNALTTSFSKLLLADQQILSSLCYSRQLTTLIRLARVVCAGLGLNNNRVDGFQDRLWLWLMW